MSFLGKLERQVLVEGDCGDEYNVQLYVTGDRRPVARQADGYSRSAPDHARPSICFVVKVLLRLPIDSLVEVGRTV